MKVDVEEPSATRRVFKIEVPSEDVSLAYSKAQAAVGRKAKIPGFRPGKIPASILERQYAGEIENEMIQKLVPTSFARALQETGVTPVDDPTFSDLKVAKGEPLRFTATVDVLPDVKIGPYLDIPIEEEDVAVTDEDIQKGIEAIRNVRAELVPAPEGARVAGGDYIRLDYDGSIDGEPAEKVQGQDLLIEIGTETLVPGFEAQVVGAGEGETREVVVTFPGDHKNPRLAGKKVTFQVTIKEIRRKTLPEVDDELARDMGHETLDALRADLRGKIADEKARARERNCKEKIVRSLVEAHPVEVPESLVERRVGSMILHAHMDLIQAEDTERLKALSERLRPIARDQIRGELVLEKIAGAEGIAATDAEVDAEIEKMAVPRSGQTPRSPEAVRAAIVKREGSLDGLRAAVRQEKTLAFLLSRAKIAPKPRIIVP